MPNYQNGKVYRILQDGMKTVYIGSTTQELSARMGQHRKGVKRWPELKLYKLMAKVGVDHFSIELILDCPCDRCETLNRAEGEQIRRHNTITEGCNHKLAGRTQAEHQQTPEYKAKDAKYRQTPECKAKAVDYRQTPEFKAKRAAQSQKPEYKAKEAARRQTPEYKAKAAERRQTPEYKVKAAESYHRRRNLNLVAAPIIVI